ncbi:MAG TPA: quinone-dependent dihydroorotate dehydrogenase, partial [Vampirovibrionales bacterium]
MIYEKALKPLLFQLDAETAHDLTIKTLSVIGKLIPRKKINDYGLLSTKIAGIKFPNKIGLAAGLDKNCMAPFAWQGLGFGFIEVGTVTAQPQEGNPKPRLFRLKQESSLLNRLGFNNLGAASVAGRLSDLKQDSNFIIPIGCNIGKSRVVSAEDTEKVIDDYLCSLKLV